MPALLFKRQHESQKSQPRSFNNNNYNNNNNKDTESIDNEYSSRKLRNTIKMAYM